MAPTSPDDDEIDTSLEETVRRELAAREDIIDYEIRESSPKHVLVNVVEQTTDDRSEEVLYRIEYEHKPEEEWETHWVDLGPSADGDSSSETDER